MPELTSKGVVTPKVAAAPPQVEERPEEIEQRRKMELLKRVRINREALRQQRWVKGDPSKNYIWVNIDPVRQTYYQTLEYVLCKDPAVQTAWKQPDGTHRCGDLILYEISKELSEAYQMDASLQALEAQEGSQESFLAFAAKSSIPVHEHK